MTALSRGYFTAWLLSVLNTSDFPVGDGNTPVEAYGWQGQPNDAGSHFLPWLSSMPGTGRPTAGSMGDSSSEHILSYTISFNAVTREQVEWIADKMRAVLVSTTRVTVNCGAFGNWRVQQARNVSIGGVMRVKSSFPDYYVQSDAFDIWVSKEIS